MGFRLCASDFSRDWDGTYEQIDFDTYELIPSRNYWIYHNSYYWYISDSPYRYDSSHVVAYKTFVPGVVDPSGSYTGMDGDPSGIVRLGVC
jgi:hypothetical protein